MSVTPIRTSQLSRVHQIIDFESQADELEVRSEEFRWKAAELIAAELADGKTQRVLADEIGKTQTHVRYMAKVGKRLLENPGFQIQTSFSEAYKQAKLSEAQSAEEARLTAVSYRTVIYEPASLILALFKGTSPAAVARHMRDFPDYATLSGAQLIEIGTALVALGHES